MHFICLTISLLLVALQELELLRSLSFDSNVVQFYGAAVMEGCPVLVLECMEVWNLTALCCPFSRNPFASYFKDINSQKMLLACRVVISATPYPMTGVVSWAGGRRATRLRWTWSEVSVSCTAARCAALLPHCLQAESLTILHLFTAHVSTRWDGHFSEARKVLLSAVWCPCSVCMGT